jgi:hypothetical protein
MRAGRAVALGQCATKSARSGLAPSILRPGGENRARLDLCQRQCILACRWQAREATLRKKNAPAPREDPQGRGLHFWRTGGRLRG